MNKLAPTLLVLLMPILLLAQTNITNETVFGRFTREGSPYNIYTNISIPASESLVIEPGVSLIFMGHYRVTVNGLLLAEGTPSDSIRMAALDPSVAWGGFDFNDDSNYNFPSDSSKISYCVISDISSVNSARDNFFLSGFSKLLISNNTIKNNKCRYGIVRCIYGSAPVIRDNIFKNNCGIQISCSGSDPSITGNYFINNGFSDLDYSNSVIQLENSKSLIANNIIANNIARSPGSAIFCLYGSSPKIVNNTIARNQIVDSQDYGTAIYYDEKSHGEITNCILWDNRSILYEGQIAIHGTSITPQIHHSIIQGGAQNGISITLEESEEDVLDEIFLNCFDVDPMFQDEENFDLKLTAASYAINTGTPDTSGMQIPMYDKDGNGRVHAERIDIGAYEYQAEVANRQPRLERIEELSMLPGARVQMEIHFTDPDETDRHSIQVTSSNNAVSVENIDTSKPFPTFDLVAGSVVPLAGEIAILLDDGSGVANARDSMKIQVSVDEFACGTISGNTVWDADTVKVACDLNVESNATLEIKPGTVVELQGLHKITVKGKLLAIGTGSEPIKFSVKDTTGFSGYDYNTGWLGLEFAHNNRDTSVLEHCHISYGSSGTDDEAHYMTQSGGAIYMTNYEKLIIRNCAISNNKAYYAGGAIFAISSKLQIENSRFHSNSSYYIGGALSLHYCEAELISDTLDYNLTSENGSAVTSYMSTLTMKNCVVVNNSIRWFERGGSALRLSGDAYLYNNLICNNQGGMYEDCNSFVMRNSILYNNAGIGGYFSGYNHEAINSIFNGTNEAVRRSTIDYSIIDTPVKTNNNYFLDPGFVNPTAGFGPDFNALEADWRLKSDSYAINTGKSGTDVQDYPLDIAGNTRLVGDRIDIGPYEFQGSPDNRRPIISSVDSIDVLAQSTTQLSFSYWDPDPDDIHTIEISSANENVRIENIQRDSTTCTFDLTTTANWTGKCEVNIKVTDSSLTDSSIADTVMIVYVTNNVCGHIEYNTTWNADSIYVGCNTVIDDEVTLVINPGVHLYLEKDVYLEIIGALKAVGTEKDSIYFSSATSGQRWKDIEIKNGFYAYGHPSGAMNNNDSTELAYCHISDAHNAGFFIDGFSKVKIHHSRFTSLNGPAIHLYESSPLIENNTIENNVTTKYESGTIWVERFSSPVIRNNIIRNNQAPLGGGINCYYHSPAVIVGNLITGNQATSGGGIYLDNSNPLILNNTVVANSATDGGGMYCRYSKPSLVNTIIWSNGSDNLGNQLYSFNYVPTAKRLLISNNENDQYNTSGEVIPGLVFNFEPNFESESGLYQLSDNSACVNTGDTTGVSAYLTGFDYLGNQRISETIDLGAFEYQGAPDNLAPVYLSLSYNRISENRPVMTYIGTIQAIDPNVDDMLTYTLVPDENGQELDNAEFMIQQDSLFSNKMFDYEVEPEKLVCIEARDSSANSLRKTFQIQIQIQNVIEAPVLVEPLSDTVAYKNSPFYFKIPSTTFSYETPYSPYYYAMTRGGDGLPSWIILDSYNGTFSGTPLEIGEYHIVVQAGWSYLKSEPDTFKITVLESMTTGLDELLENSITVYPNPTQDEIKIAASKDIKWIRIFSSAGSAVYQNNNLISRLFTVSLAGLTKGIYLVEIGFEDYVECKKVILY